MSVKFVYALNRKGSHEYVIDIFVSEATAIAQRQKYIALGRYSEKELEILPYILKEKVI